MDKQELKKLIDTAAGRIPADLVIKNCKVVNVFSGEIISGDIAVSGSKIAGIGEYEVRGCGCRRLLCGSGVDHSHIHIESSYVTP